MYDSFACVYDVHHVSAQCLQKLVEVTDGCEPLLGGE